MHHFYLKIFVPNSTLICVPQTLWMPLFTVVDGEHLLPTTVQSSSRVSFMKNLYHLCPIPNSTLRGHSSGSLQFSSSKIRQHFLCHADRGSYEDESRDKEILVDSFPESTETLGNEDCKELLRRRRISVGNKGNKPWNKGITHSPEIREKISQRTTEALRNPKVRKKMSKCPRPARSEETKAKISIAQKRVWKKRLKMIRIKEKLSLTLRWEESIAEAAKIGWSDQQELDWDSYEKMHEELNRQHIQRVEDEARAKEIEKLRAARAAKETKEKMAKLAQRRKEREQRAEARGRKTRKWSVEEKEQLAISKDLKFREKIAKIRHKAQQKRMRRMKAGYTGEEVVAREPQPAVEKLDLEFIEKEKLRREVSFADQIRAAKKNKVESTLKEALIP